MSLLKCPECRHEVSSQAPACPHCGVAIAGNIKRCPICGEICLMDAEACPQCGTQFVVERKASTATPVSPAISGSPETPGVPESPQTPEGSAIPAAPPKTENKTHWGCLIVVLLLLAAAGAGYWYYLQQQRQQQEAANYAALERCTSPKSYEDFLERYPESLHAADVRRRMDALLAEQHDWECLTQIMVNDTSRKARLNSIHTFTLRYPTSQHLKQAAVWQDSLEWKDAQDLATKEALQAYLNRPTRGDYYEHAEAWLREIMRRDSLLQDSLLQDSLAKSVTTKK